MATPADKLFATLRTTQGAGDKLKVFAAAMIADPLLGVGVVVILALIYLFGRIYLWPTLNPFKVQWIANLWDWATTPRPPTAQESYPYAKVTYRS